MKEIVKAMAQLVRRLALDRMMEVRTMKNSSMHVQAKALFQQQETELMELVRRLHFAELTAEDREKRAETDRIGGTD